jgi:Circularly permutated YpsA SLOG family
MASSDRGDQRLVAKVVTGGQSGVDRAATDVAIACGVPYGGWVPRGGWAEDHQDPPGVLCTYPSFRALASPDPALRTARNVSEVDAVIVLALGALDSPGTRLTCASARARGLPLVSFELAVHEADDVLAAFAASVPVGASLLVAGPREREQPGVYEAARAFLERHAMTLFARRAPEARREGY